jgi:WD40 repeat protein
VYDVRSDPAGEKFDGDRIEMVHWETGEVRVLYQARNDAKCGVVTFHPHEFKVVFILGPERPTPDWQYNAYHRHGVIVETQVPNQALNLDARDVVPPFTPGALRGGSHVHVWAPAGDWVSFTYEDHVLSAVARETPGKHMNLRNVGISAPIRKVEVSRDHPRNHDGEYFSVLVTRTSANPRPGTDEISKAFEEGWVGTDGYVRPDGSRQKRALAFQGNVMSASGKTLSEVFVVDLPDRLDVPGDGPLAGTELLRPFPPKGTVQRRLTRTESRRYPGLQGPRHWLRSSPDGSQIAFLMKDDEGIAQLWTVSPNGGEPNQLTHNSHPVASAFSWSPNGRFIAHVMDGSVCATDVATGETRRLTAPDRGESGPRPEACVCSPDGKKVAYVRHMHEAGFGYNQVFVVPLQSK